MYEDVPSLPILRMDMSIVICQVVLNPAIDQMIKFMCKSSVSETKNGDLHRSYRNAITPILEDI